MRFFKRITAFALILSLSVFFCLAIAILPNRLLFCGGESYRFYLGDTSLNCKEVFADSVLAPLLRLTLRDINGESATYKQLDISTFLKSVNGEILFLEEVEGSKNYYCKADLPYSVNLYGKQINLHICVSERGITVASPIIFGGY